MGIYYVAPQVRILRATLCTMSPSTMSPSEILPCDWSIEPFQQSDWLIVMWLKWHNVALPAHGFCLHFMINVNKHALKWQIYYLSSDFWCNIINGALQGGNMLWNVTPWEQCHPRLTPWVTLIPRGDISQHVTNHAGHHLYNTARR